MAAHKSNSLKNKKILITAGPTWVAIDAVRVISNIATGETGILLAKKAKQLGAKVTLIINPAKNCCLPGNIKTKTFTFFDDLRALIRKELGTNKYDIIIHSAAVSDFKPAVKPKKKISSDRFYNLKLLPLPKIIKDMRSLNPKARLVMFKLESGISSRSLIKEAGLAKKDLKAEFCVANKINPYRAFIISADNKIIPVKNKGELAGRLLRGLA